MQNETFIILKGVKIRVLSLRRLQHLKLRIVSHFKIRFNKVLPFDEVCIQCQYTKDSYIAKI